MRFGAKGSAYLHRVLLVPDVPQLMSKPAKPVSQNCHIRMIAWARAMPPNDGRRAGGCYGTQCGGRASGPTLRRWYLCARSGGLTRIGAGAQTLGRIGSVVSGDPLDGADRFFLDALLRDGVKARHHFGVRRQRGLDSHPSRPHGGNSGPWIWDGLVK